MPVNDPTNDALLPRDEHSNRASTERTADMKRSHTLKQKDGIPIRGGHTYSALRGIAHASSIVIAVAILLLCFMNVYFSDLTRSHINSILNAFQYIARFHEFVVAASLTGIVTYYLRSFLCTKEGLPLGYVASAFQLSSPQQIVSRDFWSASFSQSPKTRYWFGGLIFLSTAIVGLIGPSSAILIIPQLDWWPLKDPFSGKEGFSWVDGSYETIWPTIVDSSLINPNCSALNLETNRACPYINMVNIQNWVLDYMAELSLPNFTVTEDAGASKYLAAGDGNHRNNGYSVATTGMSYLSRSLATIWLYGVRWKLKYGGVGRPMITLKSEDKNQPLLRPVVQVQCARPLDISNATEVDVTFNTSSLVFREGETSGNISRTVNVTGFRPEDKSVRFNWTDLSADSRSLTLGALFGVSFDLPELIFPSFRGHDARALFACTVKPFWVPTTMSRDPNTDDVVILDNPKPYDILTNKNLMKKARDINIDLSFVEYVNAPFNGSSFRNVLEFELSRFAYESPSPYYHGDWVDSWQWLISSVISLQLTDALSRISHHNTVFVWNHTAPTSNARNLAFLNDIHNATYNTSDNYPDVVRADPTKFPVKWSIERFGYAWGFNKSTKVLASIVLLAHVLLSIVHLGIVWKNKLRFDSWERLIDFMTLAMQSPPPPQLDGTSAGVRDARVFADPVYIRESDDGNSAVLVMDDGSKEGQRKRLIVGKQYT